MGFRPCVMDLKLSRLYVIVIILNPTPLLNNNDVLEKNATNSVTERLLTHPHYQNFVISHFIYSSLFV